MTKRRDQFEYIEFEDHAAGAGWLEPKEFKATPLMIKAVGWVVKENRKMVVLGGCIGMNDKTSTVRQYILKRDITKRKRIYL